MAARSSFSTSLPVVIAMAAALLAGLPVSSSGLCPARCRCNDETLRGTCAYGGLDVVPIQLNPEIRHLDLSGNRITGLHIAFGFYGNLESLDLSSNLIHTLGSDNFVLQQRLVSLNLSNNAIRNIAKNALHGLTALRGLDLSGNNITEMDEQAFRYTSELEHLNLSGNSITSLPDGLLRNLHRIRSLVLSRNSLLEAPAGNLALAPSLERLDLSDNLIQELVKDSLPSLPALVYLTLANNVLRSVSDDAFDRLPGLLSLDLSGNNLTSVPTNSLAKLNVLANLVLSRNPVGALRNVAFRNLFELRNLELNDCIIADVHPRTFADNVNLEKISMDGNRDLGDLPDRVLYTARNLRWVSLRRCNLATLQPTQFLVDGLSSLRVGGNPLVCNCSVHWLWNVLQAEEIRNETRLELDSQDIVCADEEFSGKSLIKLPEGSLRCRLSSLYLSLSVAGCLAATIAILALIAYVTRAKRRKRPAYTAPNRPELLVYVGRGNEELDKNAESYSRRLIARNEELLFEPARRKSSSESPESRETNVYETPRYTRPIRREGGDPYGMYFHDQQPQQNHHQHQQQLPNEEGVYAVADVTNLRDEPPEVFSLYRMRTPSSGIRPSAPAALDYDYDCQCDYDEAPLPQKPHVVFV